jgi:phage regulator Rha-like protein
MENLIKPEGIEQFILLIRSNRVMIDRDLADLYGVETKYLNRQVKRNPRRFPIEFMFQLNPEEKNELVTNWHRFSSLKHSTYLPFVFTEHGVAMLATVLNGERAVRMSIQIIKTFIRVREFLSASKLFDERLTKLEEKVDNQLSLVFDAIDAMTTIKTQPMNPVGFKIGKKS